MQNKQLTKEKSKSLDKEQTSKSQISTKKKILSSGTFVAFIILMTPLLFYIHHFFPDSPTFDTIFGRMDSSYYQNVQIFIWVVFGKVTPLILLLIWFLTCKHWWYHAIIVPVAVITYQILIALNEDIVFLDFNDIYFLFPLVAAVAAFSYGIRIKIFDRIYGVDLDEDLKRVRWNGKIVKVPANSPLDLEEVGDDEIDDDDDDDKEPMWMA